MFYTMYSKHKQFACIGFDNGQMKRLFPSGDPADRFDYAIDTKSFKDKIPEKLVVDFVNDGNGVSGDKIPDIQVLSFHNKGIFLSLEAYKALYEIIKHDGEFIAVTYENGNGYIFNPLYTAEDVDGLNEELSLKNEWGDVENIVFYEEKVKKHAIVKTRFDTYQNIYCRKDVKEAVEKANLQGVAFTPELGSEFGMTQDQKVSPH